MAKETGSLVSLNSLTCNSKSFFFFNECNKSKHTKYTLKNENKITRLKITLLVMSVTRASASYSEMGKYKE